MKIKDLKFGLEEIAMSTSRRLCLICNKNLDEDMPSYNWHIPLCKKHRSQLLEEIK